MWGRHWARKRTKPAPASLRPQQMQPTPTGVARVAGRLCCMARVRATDSKPHQTLSRLPCAQNATRPTGTARVGREASVHGPRDSCWLKTTPKALPAFLRLKTRPAQPAPPAWAGKLQRMVYAIAAGSKPHQTLSRLPCGSKHDPPNRHRPRGPGSFQRMVYVIATDSKPHQTLSRLPGGSKRNPPNRHRPCGPGSFQRLV